MSSKVDKATAFIELCRRSAMFFRENLIMDGGHGPAPWGEFMADNQRRDFEAISPAMEYLCGVTKTKPQYQKFYRQRARGGSKTTDTASDVLWLNAFSPRKLSMICAAEDRDQAGLVREQAEMICQMNPWLRHFVDIQKNRIVNKQNETIMEVLTGDVKSSFGLTPHVTVADEFTHWSDEKFWSSMFSSYAKTERYGGILLVSANAGWGRDWKWELTQSWAKDPTWYYSAPPGPAVWYSKETIEGQRKGLTSLEFKRLWENSWVETGGEFVTLEEAEACVDPDLKPQTQTAVDGYEYVAAIDYAERVDRAVGVVTHIYNGQIIVDRMDVIDPKLYGGSIPVAWVEQWMRDIDERFGGHRGNVVFVVDRHQLVSSIQRLTGEGFEIVEFEFMSGKGNYMMSRNLLQLIQQKMVKWYPGCGTIYDEDGRVFEEHKGRNDLCTELASLTQKTLPNRMWRFDHNPGGHDDRAFALGAACLHIVQNSDVFGNWEILPPMHNGGFRLNNWN